MTASFRTTVVAGLAMAGLVLSVMLPSDPRDIGGVDAAHPAPPPLHVSVPTEPYRAAQ